MNYVHRGPVVAADALVMAADHAVGSPQGEDHVAAVRAVVVAADAVPLGRSQGAEGDGSRLLGFWAAVTPLVPPERGRQDYDEQEQERAAGEDPHQHV